MNASQARKKAEQKASILERMVEQRVRDHIKDRAENGEFSLEIGYTLTREVINNLVNDGFQVYKQKEGNSTYEIAW